MSQQQSVHITISVPIASSSSENHIYWIGVPLTRRHQVPFLKLDHRAVINTEVESFSATAWSRFCARCSARLEFLLRCSALVYIHKNGRGEKIRWSRGDSLKHYFRIISNLLTRLVPFVGEINSSSLLSLWSSNTRQLRPRPDWPDSNSIVPRILSHTYKLIIRL